MAVRRYIQRHESRFSPSPWGTREVKRLWTWCKTCDSRQPRMKQESRRFQRWECQKGFKPSPAVSYRIAELKTREREAFGLFKDSAITQATLSIEIERNAIDREASVSRLGATRPCGESAAHLISYLCRGAARTHLIMSVAGARMYCLRIESRARFV